MKQARCTREEIGQRVVSESDESVLPTISVVIGTHGDRSEVLRDRAVGSILVGDYPKDLVQVIVVDNHAEDDFYRPLCELFADNENVTVVREPRVGCSFSRNAGMDVATGEIVACIDDDCEVDPGWLRRLAEFYRDSAVQFGGGAIYDTALKKLVRSRGDDPEWPPERRIIFGNMSFRRSLLERNRPDNNMIYGKEEFELAYRLLAQGLVSYFDPEPITHHRALSDYREGRCGQLNDFGRREVSYAEVYFAVKKTVFSRHLGASRGAFRYWAREAAYLPSDLVVWAFRSLSRFPTIVRRFAAFSRWYPLRILWLPLTVRMQVLRDLSRLSE
jgi:glycosyltransferase involved in cell wall biosynthesis